MKTKVEQLGELLPLIEKLPKEKQEKHRRALGVEIAWAKETERNDSLRIATIMEGQDEFMRESTGKILDALRQRLGESDAYFVNECRKQIESEIAQV